MAGLLISIRRGISIEGALPHAQAGVSLSATLTVDGAEYGVDWSMIGTLPPGLQLVFYGTTATVSGVATTPGEYTVTFTAVDGRSYRTSRTYTMRITQADELLATDGSLTAPGDTLGALATAGEAYVCQITPIGGVPPYSWALVSGALAPGLSFNTGNGQITGTPTAPNASSTAHYHLADSASHSISVAMHPVVLDMAIQGTPLTATRGVPYSYQFEALGGHDHSWSISAGSLPQGLTLQPDGRLAGVPEVTTVGTTVTVRCDSAGGAVDSKSVTIVVDAATITVDVDTPSTATVGSYYELPIITSGSPGPFTPSVVSGSLPDGFTFYSENRIIGHLPNVLAEAVGSHTFTVRMTDPYGNFGDATVTIDVVAGPLVVNGGSDANWSAKVGSGFRAPEVPSLGAYGGLEPISWAVTAGSLPPGISFSSFNTFRGIFVAGMPTTAGTYVATFTATDSQTPADTASVDVTITVDP